MAKVEELAALQEREETLARNAARLREIERLLQEPEALLAARQRLQTAEAELDALRRTLRALEDSAAIQRRKRDGEQAKLYSGKVTNPRELEDLTKESEFLSRRLAQLEEEMLQVMLQQEEAMESLRAARQRLAELEQEQATRSGELRAEAERLRAEMADLQESARELRQRIPAEYLARYDAIKARKNGKAVARVRNNSCQVCGVDLPTHVVQRAQQGLELVLCPSCGRILCAG
jgi:predicted  nucleic acid-binding Zn-ribbon protein